MTNVDRLHEIEKMRFKIDKQKELIDYYETMSRSLGGGGYEEKVQCTRSYEAPFVKWIYKKLDAEAVLKTMEQELDRKIDEMSIVVEMMDNIDYRRIITYRYLLNQDWETVADSLHLSLSTIYRYHRRALEDLKEVKVL